MGLGMKVSVFPDARARFLSTYLYIITWSAILLRFWNRMPISHWPAVATSWWCTSHSMPAFMSSIIARERKSCRESVGGTGKYPSLCLGR